MKKLLFIFNPNTGGGRLKTKLMPILCAFSKAGYQVTVFPTGARGDAQKYAAEYGGGFKKVVCCGGDGTLNEVVDGLMQLEERPVLGYIPGGTTNDFASSLRLPKSDMLAAAARVIKPKRLYACDVGCFNQRHFTYVAAFGAFTQVSYATPQAFKNVFGYFAYILEGVQSLPNIQPYRLKIEHDGEVLEDEFVFGMISNSTSVGGFSFGKDTKISLDDGVFEVLLVRKPQNLIDLGGISAAIIGRNVDSQWIHSIQVKNLTITSDTEIAWTLDGEFGGSYKEVDIEVRPKAIELCI